MLTFNFNPAMTVSAEVASLTSYYFRRAVAALQIDLTWSIAREFHRRARQLATTAHADGRRSPR